MGKDSAIGWTDHTWNPWIGCQEVSPACDNCYARVQNEHWKWTEGWGPHGKRTRTSDSNWCKPLSWERKAAKLGVRYKVFCGSLCDIADNRVPPDWHADVWMQVRCTPHLDWLMLTKRPQNIPGQLPADWGDGYPNVWLGTTVENQAEADRRIPQLLAVPARVHFLSCEPLLEPVDLSNWLWNFIPCPNCPCTDPSVDRTGYDDCCKDPQIGAPLLQWVIGGLESGPKRRDPGLVCIEDLRKQCADAGTAFYFKQDSHLRAGQRGRASDDLWACKQYPELRP